jgi:tol-pal system protein YbgF
MKNILALACAALLIVTVPAGAANREHQQMMADIRMLQEQTQQLQAMLGTLTETLRTVTAKIDEQSGNNRKAFADSKMLVDNVAGDMRILREKVDDSNVRLSTLSQEVEALRAAIPIAAAPSAYPPPDGFPPNPADPSAGQPAATTPGIIPGEAPQKMYDRAFADYTAGQWGIAVMGFEAYIKTYPRSELADDAQYYVGEAHFADGKNEQAVVAFDAVLRNYPKGDKVPEASYKKGIVLARLGRDEEARAAYQYVVTNFPDNPAANLARQRLEQLNRPRR